MTYLYEGFENRLARNAVEAAEVPQCIVGNLKHRIRPYQIEAFKRFLVWQEEYTDCLPHLLFNMATGSGKTLIMAGLMLRLYEQGYRNFCFFVNSNNIIQKTKDNFLDKATTKYLFTEVISVEGREVAVNEVDNFADARENCINIKFTTIQQLHTDLANHKENGVTLKDLGAHKMILLADEAHHLNVKTQKQAPLLDNWESTVINIMKANPANMLLEFTATVNYNNNDIVEKYRDKIIYRYDLKQFRKDLYSKEINLFRSDFAERERIIQALILNIYRQELAALHNINLKPVILFKAKRTIAKSEENKEKFHQLMDNFSAKDVTQVKKSTAPIIARAFAFFQSKGLTDSMLAQRIRDNFTRENCISANNEAEKEQNQIRLNTLEDSDNPLRAVFAVQRLNEGWDVLNLFDIVRLYETEPPDAHNNQPSATTIAEAQLIGRGARYFPFQVNDEQDAFTRKYDDEADNEFKILEELYYHTRDDSQYIAELKIALEATGIYEDDSKTRQMQLSLKDDFKETALYKKGRVFLNKKTYSAKPEVNRSQNRTLSDLSTAVKIHVHRLDSGVGSVVSGLDVLEAQDQTADIRSKIISANEMPFHVKQSALSSNPFYWFDNLHDWFGVKSMSKFINEPKHLGGFQIKFEGTLARLGNIANRDYFVALQRQLVAAENEIKRNTVEFVVSGWIPEYVHKIFTDKQVRVKNEYAGGQQVAEESAWYGYNNNYGTPEETAFVEMFDSYFNKIKQQHKNIYLLRNERQLKIYDKKGRGFEPDFVLFCNPKSAKALTYQIFIEPKGKHLFLLDKWKEEFLASIGKKGQVIKITAGEYTILGLPFFNNENPKRDIFEKAFAEMLEL